MQIFPRYSRMLPNHFFITFHNFWLLFFLPNFALLSPSRQNDKRIPIHTHTHLDTEINSLPGWIHPKTSRSLLHAPSRFRWSVRAYCLPDTDGHWWTLFFLFMTSNDDLSLERYHSGWAEWVLEISISAFPPKNTLQIWIYVSPSVTLLGEQKPHLFCLPPAALLKETTHLDILFPTLCRNSRSRRRNHSSWFFLRYTHSQFTEWRLPLVLFIYLTITFLCTVYKTTITTTFFYVGWFSLTR